MDENQIIDKKEMSSDNCFKQTKGKKFLKTARAKRVKKLKEKLIKFRVIERSARGRTFTKLEFRKSLIARRL